MNPEPLAMQKNIDLPRFRRCRPFDTIPGRAYPKHYVSPVRRQRNVLLLPDAGVWVGTSEILPTHPANAGGFCFHPLCGEARVGSERIILTKSIY